VGTVWVASTEAPETAPLRKRKSVSTQHAEEIASPLLAEARALFAVTDETYAILHDALHALGFPEGADADKDEPAPVGRGSFVNGALNVLLPTPARDADRARGRAILERVFDYFAAFEAFAENASSLPTALDAEQLSVGFQSVTLHGIANETCAVLFEIFDVHQRGSIGLKELAEYYEHTLVFANALREDADRSPMSELQARSVIEAGKMMSEASTKNNDAIDLDEFQAWYENHKKELVVHESPSSPAPYSISPLASAALAEARILFAMSDAAYAALHSDLDSMSEDALDFNSDMFVAYVLDRILPTDAAISDRADARARGRTHLESVFHQTVRVEAFLDNVDEGDEVTEHLDGGHLVEGLHVLALPGSARETCAALFDSYDVNTSNSLSRTELESLLQHSLAVANVFCVKEKQLTFSAMRARVHTAALEALVACGKDQGGDINRDEFRTWYERDKAAIVTYEATLRRTETST
jgi:Ca2+-binding EF-hand superfamily protein